MHIVVVCRGLGTSGSVAAVALRQSQELARHADISLVSESLPDDTPWARRQLVHVPNLHILRRLRHVADEYLFARSARAGLFVMHQRDPIDFVLCHGHAAAFLAARPLRQRAGVPFGFVTHGDIFDRPRGTYDPRLTAFYKWVTPRAYRTSDLVFALSPYMADLARRGGAKAVEVVPNGIDPEDIGLATESRGQSDRLRLLYVGRFSVEKGIQVLIEMCALRRDLDFVLDLVGDGLLLPRLRQLTARDSRVTLLGRRPRRELGAIYRSHDALVLPSLSEAFPTVLLEALASGTPVIASNVGGIPSIVQHGRNGLLVSPADARALADAIALFARDAGLRRSLFENARSSVLPRFSWMTIGDRMAGLIARVAGG